MADDQAPLTNMELDALLTRSWRGMRDGLSGLVDSAAGLAQVEDAAKRKTAEPPDRARSPQDAVPPSRPPASGRQVADYSLSRRVTLAAVRAGRTPITDVCDAHPYLLRAAKYHGEETDVVCPICRKGNVTHVTYVYGNELGQYAGSVKRTPELDEMATEHGEFRAYVVEVCQSCGWNHLAMSYLFGSDEVRALSATGNEQPDHDAEPQPDVRTRLVRITLRDADMPLPPGTDHITEIIAAVI